MIRIEPRDNPSRAFAVGIPVLSAIIALALAVIPLLAAGAKPIAAYDEIITGVFGSIFACSEMLTRATSATPGSSLRCLPACRLSALSLPPCSSRRSSSVPTA